MSSVASIFNEAHKTRRRLLLALTAVLSVLLAPAVAHASVDSGALSQLPSPSNCVGNSEESVGAICGTTVGGGMQGAYQVAVSPDGANVYSVGITGALIEYSRNLANGALTVIGCITGVGAPPATAPCAPTNAEYGVTVVDSLSAIAISPDGKNVYLLDQDKNMVVELGRDAETGLLTMMKGGKGEPECITEEAGLCEHTGAIGLSTPYGITVSPDGETVYVASLSSESVAELARNTSTGTLEAIAGHECIGSAGSGCPDNTAKGLTRAIGVVVSPDGKDLYVAAGAKEGKGEGDVAAFKRNAGGVLEQLSGEKGCISEKIAVCTKAKALQGSEDLAISPNGKDVYATSFETNALVVIERNAATGVLTQLTGEAGCVSTTFAGCTAATGIKGTLGVAVSPDGANIYASGNESNAEASFTRNSSTGALAQLGTEDPCVTSEASGCGTEFNEAIGLDGARRVAVSPDGTNLYVAGQSASAIVELARTVTPTVTEVNPKSGSEAGGHEVTIEGTGFREGAQVLFQGKAAASVTVSSATSITAVTPSDAGPSDVQVENAAGESAVEPVHAKYDFTTPTEPSVTEVSPNNGAEPAETTVTITGSEFVEPAVVHFGSALASGVTVNSGDSITATAPPGTGTVDVTVETSHGTSATSSADSFEYHAGGLSLAPYCESLGYPGNGAGATILLRGGVEGPEFAYENWACVQSSGATVPIANLGAAPSMADACAVQYPKAPSHAYPEDVNNAFSWSCHLIASPERERERTKATTTTTTTTRTGGGGGGGSGPPGVPPPVILRTGDVAPVSGTVLVRLPGTTTFVALTTLRQIPFGTIINATNGRVSVTTALPHGGTQTGEFFSGEFILSQSRDGTVTATLTGGSFAGCPTAKERAHRARVAASSGKHVVRKLWANAHGKFSTKGNYAAGAVQGTEWLTEDLCEGTLIRVTRDKVRVTDLVRHRHKTVKVGHSYLAKAP
jgi:DNA-binding beta-propeller fold protein YncE